MDWDNNPFSLLAEYEDGGDVTILLAKFEAKIAAAAMQWKQPKSKSKAPADWLPSKPPLRPALRAEKDEGRGGRGHGLWRGGFRSGSSGDADDVDGKLVDGYTRGGSDFRGRGHGRGLAGGRGRRGRGRGRGFYEVRGFDNENHYDAGVQNQGKGGDNSGEGIDVQGKNNDLVEYHEHRYDGDYRRRFRGGGDRQRRGFGFVGGSLGFRDDVRLRYVVKEPKSLGQNKSHNQEDTPHEKGQIGDHASGWDMPASTDVPKGELHNADQKQLFSAKSLEKNPNEEDNEMTLDEYEKVLQEKRKALESLKNQERKVVLDEDFENMQLVGKKKEDDFIKLKIREEKLKRQRSFEKEERVRKAVSINEFLKPAEGERFDGPLPGRGRADGRGRGRGVHGGSQGGSTGRRGHIIDVPAVLQFEDVVQFPLLGATAKAR